MICWGIHLKEKDNEFLKTILGEDLKWQRHKPHDMWKNVEKEISSVNTLHSNHNTISHVLRSWCRAGSE